MEQNVGNVPVAKVGGDNCRGALDLGDRAVSDDTALVEDHNSLADCKDHLYVMLDEDDR